MSSTAVGYVVRGYLENRDHRTCAITHQSWNGIQELEKKRHPNGGMQRFVQRITSYRPVEKTKGTCPSHHGMKGNCIGLMVKREYRLQCFVPFKTPSYANEALKQWRHGETCHKVEEGTRKEHLTPIFNPSFFHCHCDNNSR